MYTLSHRANTVFAFFISVLFAVLAAVAVSGPLLIANVPKSALKANIGVDKVVTYVFLEICDVAGGNAVIHILCIYIVKWEEWDITMITASRCQSWVTFISIWMLVST